MPPRRKKVSSSGRGGDSAATSKVSGKARAISKKKPPVLGAKGIEFLKSTGMSDDGAAKFLQRAQERISTVMQKAQAPTPIPGWSHSDVLGGTRGCAKLGHSIHDMDDPRLKDPKLHARCFAWMPLSLSDLKAACQKYQLLREGSKKVLALRLAIKAPKAKP